MKLSYFQFIWILLAINETDSGTIALHELLMNLEFGIKPKKIPPPLS